MNMNAPALRTLSGIGFYSRMSKVLMTDVSETNIEHIWNRHIMLGHKPGDECECFLLMIEAMAEAWPDVDSLEHDAFERGEEKAREDAEYDATDSDGVSWKERARKAEERLEEALQEAVDAKSWTDETRKAAALSEGNAEGQVQAKREVLAALHSAMTTPRTFKKTVERLMAQLTREINR